MASVWSALTDPHRRRMVELLRIRARTVAELVELTGLSQPSTSKHLRVLRDAGLVRARTHAQWRLYELLAAPLAELDAWLAPYRRMWEDAQASRARVRHARSARPADGARPPDR